MFPAVRAWFALQVLAGRDPLLRRVPIVRLAAGPDAQRRHLCVWDLLPCWGHERLRVLPNKELPGVFGKYEK